MAADDAMVRVRRDTSKVLPEIVPWARSQDEVIQALIRCWRSASDEQRTKALLQTVRARKERE